MENSFKITNLEKVIPIFAEVEYMMLHAIDRVIPITICWPRSSFDIEYSWQVSESHTEICYLSKLIAKNMYDIDNCEFWAYKSFDKIKFFQKVPIEINTLFSSEEDIADIFNSFGNKVILEFDSNSKMKDFEYLASLVLDQGVITVNGKDRTSFRDILNCGRPAYLSLLSLYGLQDHIHNNIIHMKTKGYFRFWKLVPLDFRKAI